MIGFAGYVLILSVATLAVAQSTGSAGSFWSQALLRIRAAGESKKEPARDGDASELDLIVRQLRTNAALNQKLKEVIAEQGKQIRELAKKLDGANQCSALVELNSKRCPNPLSTLLNHVPYYRQIYWKNRRPKSVVWLGGMSESAWDPFFDWEFALRPHLVADDYFGEIYFLGDNPDELDEIFEVDDSLMYIWTRDRIFRGFRES